VRIGETYVHGRDPGTARMLLAAAEQAGLPSFVVQTTTTGFIVPDPVWDVVEANAPVAGTVEEF
jgi:hypothetical protein